MLLQRLHFSFVAMACCLNSQNVSQLLSLLFLVQYLWKAICWNWGNSLDLTYCVDRLFGGGRASWSRPSFWPFLMLWGSLGWVWSLPVQTSLLVWRWTWIRIGGVIRCFRKVCKCSEGLAGVHSMPASCLKWRLIPGRWCLSNDNRIMFLGRPEFMYLRWQGMIL